jgi:hypothetical protein
VTAAGDGGNQELELKIKLQEELKNLSVVIPDFSSQAIELHHPSGSRTSRGQERRDNVRTSMVIECNNEIGTNLLVCNIMDHGRV